MFKTSYGLKSPNDLALESSCATVFQKLTLETSEATLHTIKVTMMGLGVPG